MTAEVRTTEQGNTISVDLLRDFILHALSHDAAQDRVNDLLFEHVVNGRFHPSVVAESLKPIIDEILETATSTDWQGVADQLIETAREIEGEASAD